MADAIQRPRIFISSTIREFRDLREALKYWLEELGFEVQLSEHNDFLREPDAGTLEACFNNIRECDYYLLLIGRDQGWLIDPEKRLSVTRQEYRTAMTSWEESGRPRIVTAIRAETMVALRERKTAKTPDEAESQYLQDPEFVRDFVAEVRREAEAEEATKGRREHPPSNWLAEFANFRELTDLLRATLNIRGPLQKQALIENLRHELRRNLWLALMSISDAMMPRHTMADGARDGIRISREDDLRGTTTLSHQQLKALIMYHPTDADSLIVEALGEAIRSGALLEFDVETGAFRPSELLTALYVLRDEIAVFRRRSTAFVKDKGEVAAVWFSTQELERSGNVPTLALISLFALNDSEKNFVWITRAILRHLYGHTPGIDYRLRPRSPVEGEGEKMEAESVSPERLEEALRKDSLQLGLGEDHDQKTHELLAEGQALLRAKLGDRRYEAMNEIFRKKLGETPPDTREDVNRITDEALDESLGIDEGGG